MVGIVVVTRAAVLIARRASTWTVDEHLAGLSPGCVAVDLSSPAQVYCGTARARLFRSRDSGRNWEPVGRGIDHLMVTAVDVGHAEQADGFGVVYAGTEPSAVFRSDNGAGRVEDRNDETVNYYSRCDASFPCSQVPPSRSFELLQPKVMAALRVRAGVPFRTDRGGREQTLVKIFTSA